MKKVVLLIVALVISLQVFAQDGEVLKKASKDELFNTFLKTSISSKLTAPQQQEVYQQVIDHMYDSLFVTIEHMSAEYNLPLSSLNKSFNNDKFKEKIIARATTYAKKIYDVEVQKKVELEREKAELERIELIQRIAQNLNTYLSNAVEFASSYDEHFNANAYKKFEQIIDMFLSNQLEYIVEQVAPRTTFYGWVDKNGKPYGPAIIIKKYSKDHYLGYQYGSINSERYYDGVFFDGKPIYGAMAKLSGSLEDVDMRGFMNFQGRATQGKRSYMRYRGSYEGFMASVDVNGNRDGISVGDYVYLDRSGDRTAMLINQEEMMPLYNYMTNGQPSTGLKIVDNFFLKPNVTYTGEWKDGAPAGSGVTLHKGQSLTFEKRNSLGKKEKVCRITKSTYLRTENRHTETSYQETNSTDKGFNNIYVSHNGRTAIGIPAGNNNVGYEVIQTLDKLSMYTLMIPTTTPIEKIEDVQTEQKQKIGKQFEFSDRVMQYTFYPYYGEGATSYTCVKLTTGGSYTIESIDDQKRHILQKRVNGAYTFEGMQLADNKFIGVYYDNNSQYVYIGHMSADEDGALEKSGAGYQIDVNDGEIMQQGIWANNVLNSNMAVKESVNAEISVDLSAICAKNKVIKKASTRKLATGVSAGFDFRFFEQRYK